MAPRPFPQPGARPPGLRPSIALLKRRRGWAGSPPLPVTRGSPLDPGAWGEAPVSGTNAPWAPGAGAEPCRAAEPHRCCGKGSSPPQVSRSVGHRLGEWAEVDGGAAPAGVGAELQPERERAEPVSGGDPGERLDNPVPRLVLATAPHDGRCGAPPGGAQRGLWGELDQPVVGCREGVPEEGVHGALTAEGEHQPVGEPVARQPVPLPTRRGGGRSARYGGGAGCGGGVGCGCGGGRYGRSARYRRGAGDGEGRGRCGWRGGARGGCVVWGGGVVGGGCAAWCGWGGWCRRRGGW